MSFIRKFIIKASGQITLPVTPESFEVSYGRHTETVSIHEVGDVNLPGGMALGTIKVGCMFPENDYPFALDSGEPYEYVGRIEKIIKRKKPVRFVVSGTGINERVLIEEISYGERDGTGDVYATITMRGYRKVSASQTAAVGAIAVPAVTSPAVNLPRESDTDTAAPVQKRIPSYKGKKYQSYAEIVKDAYKITDGNEIYRLGLALSRYNNSEKNTVPAMLFSDQKIVCPPLDVLNNVGRTDKRTLL